MLTEYEGSFRERLHSYGASKLFLTGIIMFSGGSLLNIMLSFGFFSVFSLLILAVPLTGFWLIYAASKSPAIPEKTLPALILFKVIIIMNMVIWSLFVLLILIIGFSSFSLTANYISFDGADPSAFGFLALFTAGIMLTIIIIYFKALLKVIGSIKYGIINNSLKVLSSVNVFSILAYISIALSSLINLIVAFSFNEILDVLVFEFPEFMEFLIEAVPTQSDLLISVFLTLAADLGLVLCIVCLGKLNKSLLNAGEKNP